MMEVQRNCKFTMNFHHNHARFNLGKLLLLKRLVHHPFVTDVAIQNGVNNAKVREDFSTISRDGIVEYYQSHHQFKIDVMINSLKLHIDESSESSDKTHVQISQENPYRFTSKVLDICDITDKILLHLDLKSLTCCRLINLAFLILATEQLVSLSHVNLSDLCKIFMNHNNKHLPFDLLSIKYVESIKIDAFWPWQNNQQFQNLAHFKNIKHITFDTGDNSTKNYHNKMRFGKWIETMMLNNMTRDNYNIESVTVNIGSLFVANGTLADVLEDILDELSDRDEMYTREAQQLGNVDTKFQSKLKHFKINLIDGLQPGYIKKSVIKWFEKLDIDFVSIDFDHICSRSCGVSVEMVNSFAELRQEISKMKQANSKIRYNVKKVQINIKFDAASVKHLNGIMTIILDMGKVITGNICANTAAAAKKLSPHVSMNSVLQHIVDGDENRCKLWQNISLQLERSKTLVEFVKNVYRWYKLNKDYLLSIFGVAVIGDHNTIKVRDLSWIQLIINVFKHVFVQQARIQIDDDGWCNIKSFYVKHVDIDVLTLLMKINNRLAMHLVKEKRISSSNNKWQTMMSVRISVSKS